MVGSIKWMIGNIHYDQPSPARDDLGGAARGEKMIMPSSPGTKLLCVLGAILGIAIGGFVWYWVTNPLIVTVTGTGKVSVPATAATIGVSVGTISPEVGGALSDLRVKVDKIKTLLTDGDFGVTDIIESQIQLTPASMVVAGAEGFQAMLTMNVKTSYVSQVGDLVVNLYQSGATVVDQPVVSVENQEDLEKEALNQALKESEKNLNEIAVKKLKPIRKILSMEQASSGTTAAGIKQVESGDEMAVVNGTFEVVRAVSSTYALW